ncbi:MAG: hypothetical protein ACR2J8_02420 [Thermomicrobiales bacterium]
MNEEREAGVVGLIERALAGRDARHVMQFGCSEATGGLVRLTRRLGRLTCLSVVEHDPERLRRLLMDQSSGWAEPKVSFSAAAAVLRVIDGEARTVYCPEEIVPASLAPADAIVIEGPPAGLGGRAGMVAQALTFSRAGTVIVLPGLDAGERAGVMAFVGQRRELVDWADTPGGALVAMGALPAGWLSEVGG